MTLLMVFSTCSLMTCWTERGSEFLKLTTRNTLWCFDVDLLFVALPPTILMPTPHEQAVSLAVGWVVKVMVGRCFRLRSIACIMRNSGGHGFTGLDLRLREEDKAG